MTTGVLDQAPAHPLVRLVEDLEHLVTETAGGAAWTLTPGQLVDLLPRLSVVKRQLDAVELRILREADRHQVGDPLGAANTAGWWANSTQITKPAAHKAVALAARLDDDTHTPTVEGLSRGRVSTDQAAVILDAIDALPAELVTPTLRRDAETHLVELAKHHDPKDLRILGRKVLDVLAPQIADEHERRILEGEEQHAAATASFVMRPDGHGSMYGRFKIPTLAGEILAKHLNALAAPKHRASTDPGPDGFPAPETVTRPLRLGTAFIEYIETRPDTAAPKAGGLAATVVVTMTLEALLGAQTAASLDTGGWISASEARRLVCEAGIYPAVLGSRSQVLDLGRKTRLHTEAMRIAVMLQDKHCRATGCDWPPGMCHVHHPTPWSQGGTTSVKNGMLLCPRHHTIAHDSRYQMKTGPGGKVTFSRRT